MNADDMKGQAAIVTGGAQGIGGSVTEALAGRGAKVAIWDIDRERAADTARRVGVGAIAIAADVSDRDSVEAAMETSRSVFGKVDILVNAAGVAGMNAPLADYPIDEFERIVAINLTGTFLVNRAVVPLMVSANYGRIVNIASVAGKEGNPNASAYSASKAGVIGLTKSLGKELAGHDIAVNCVTPAAAKTRIFEQMKQEHIDFMLAKIPRGRFLELDEAASMIAWLVSRQNSFATGAAFDLSGGRATY